MKHTDPRPEWRRYQRRVVIDWPYAVEVELERMAQEHGTTPDILIQIWIARGLTMHLHGKPGQDIDVTIASPTPATSY